MAPPPPCVQEKFRYEADSVPDYIIGDHVALVNRSHDELSRVFTLVGGAGGVGQPPLQSCGYL